VGTIFGFFVFEYCLRCLFPFTNCPACNAGRAGEVELFPTFAVAATQSLQYWQTRLPYNFIAPVLVAGCSGLWLYGKPALGHPIIHHHTSHTQSCCKQYLTTRLSQSVPLDTTCPILSCKQPVTRSTFQQLLTPEVMSQYELAVVKSYVEMSKWFTWCRNPQGCGMALRKADGSQSGTCNKCHWSSCFNCTFAEVMYIMMPSLICNVM